VGVARASVAAGVSVAAVAQRGDRRVEGTKQEAIMNLPGNTVRLAVTSEDTAGLEARVGQHFGRCPAYTLVDVEGGRIGTAQVVANPFVGGHAPGDVPSFIAGTDAQVLLTGGIGQRAISFFDAHGIEVSAGHSGTVSEAVDAWLAGTAGGPAACGGHDHADEGHGHGGCGHSS
jgi:predicted Fe-Mo cluster-binding NifX family protein